MNTVKLPSLGKGTWVKDQRDEWHWSVEFDGYDHQTACEIRLDARGSVQEIELDPRTVESLDVCDVCHADAIKFQREDDNDAVQTPPHTPDSRGDEDGHAS